MGTNASSESRDALRIQVAAVVAQQAAVTEQEIRFGEVRDQFLSEQRALVSDVESLLLHLLVEEERLEVRQADVRTREAFVARLESACSRLVREIDIVQHSLAREDSRPQIRAA